MDIEYHEASALVRMPDTATLDDHHKMAWRLFMKDCAPRQYDERPFVFRVIPVGGRALFTVRSEHDFAQARPASLSVHTGQRMAVDLPMIPTRRHKKREFIPPDDEWPRLWSEKLARAGLTPTADPRVNVSHRVGAKLHSVPSLLVANGQTEVVVADAPALCRAWLSGVGRNRAYGLGMLSSPVEA